MLVMNLNDQILMFLESLRLVQWESVKNGFDVLIW